MRANYGASLSARARAHTSTSVSSSRAGFPSASPHASGAPSLPCVPAPTAIPALVPNGESILRPDEGDDLLDHRRRGDQVHLLRSAPRRRFRQGGHIASDPWLFLLCAGSQ